MIVAKLTAAVRRERWYRLLAAGVGVSRQLLKGDTTPGGIRRRFSRFERSCRPPGRPGRPRVLPVSLAPPAGSVGPGRQPIGDGPGRRLGEELRRGQGRRFGARDDGGGSVAPAGPPQGQPLACAGSHPGRQPARRALPDVHTAGAIRVSIVVGDARTTWCRDSAEGLECLEEAGYRAPSIRPTTIGPLGLLRSGDSFPGSDGPRRGLRGRTWAEAKVEPYIELVLTVRPYAGQPEQPGGGVQGCQRIALEVGPSFPT